MKKQLLKTALFGALGLSLLTASYAQQNHNQISFNTQVSQEIANDQIRVRLSKTAQANDIKTLANTLNHTINQALATSKKYPEITVSTGHQHTYPRHNKHGTIVGFTGFVSLDIHSQNFNQVSEFVSQLQSTMVVDGLSFGVSEQNKQAIEKDLMQQAVQRFQNDAQNISHAFGAKGYKIVSVNLDNADYQAQNFAYKARSAAESADIDIAPEFASGNSKLVYRASGTIELIYPQTTNK